MPMFDLTMPEGVLNPTGRSALVECLTAASRKARRWFLGSTADIGGSVRELVDEAQGEAMGAAAATSRVRSAATGPSDEGKSPMGPPSDAKTRAATHTGVAGFVSRKLPRKDRSTAGQQDSVHHRMADRGPSGQASPTHLSHYRHLPR